MSHLVRGVWKNGSTAVLIATFVILRQFSQPFPLFDAIRLQPKGGAVWRANAHGVAQMKAGKEARIYGVELHWHYKPKCEACLDLID